MIKKNILAVIFAVTIVFPGSSCRGQDIQLISQRFTIPNYSGHQNQDLNGIAYSQGKIFVSTDTSWGEFPLSDGDIDFNVGFIAPTQGYQIKAIGIRDGEPVIFDGLSNAIIVNRRGKLLIAGPVPGVCGLAWYRGAYYLADMIRGEILCIDRYTGSILQAYPAPNGIRGLTCDGSNLYACSAGEIYKYDANMNVVQTYAIDVMVNGIAVLGENTFAACAVKNNTIYILE